MSLFDTIGVWIFSSIISFIVSILIIILILWLITKYLKIWWLKSIIFGAIIGGVILFFPLGFLSEWILCPTGNGDCQFGAMFFGGSFAPVLGAIIMVIVDLRNQKKKIQTS